MRVNAYFHCKEVRSYILLRNQLTQCQAGLNPFFRPVRPSRRGTMEYAIGDPGIDQVASLTPVLILFLGLCVPAVVERWSMLSVIRE